MSKQNKAGGFPAPLEIVKCREGNKAFLKERPARKPYGRLVRVCEYTCEAVSEFDSETTHTIWRLAKRAARDFLRASWITTAIIKADPKENVVRIYGKY